MKGWILGAALALVAPVAMAQSYASQLEFDRSLVESALDVTFLAFEGETSWGKATRCQLQYRLVKVDRPGQGSAPQILQGSVTSDYYDDRPINFILNLQPVRVQVNPATRTADSSNIVPSFATLRVNGLDLEPYRIAAVDCDAGVCFAFAPSTATQVAEVIKAVHARPVFDAEITYALGAGQAKSSFTLSSLRTNLGSVSDARKEFTACLQEIVKRELGDIRKLTGEPNGTAPRPAGR